MTDVVLPMVTATLADIDGPHAVTAVLLGHATRVAGKPVMVELLVLSSGRYTTAPFERVAALNREAVDELSYVPPGPGAVA